jgi:hypothetical protein
MFARFPLSYRVGPRSEVSSGKVEENHGCIRATEGEVYIRSGRKELGLEGASRCYIWDGDWVITHVPRDKPYGRHEARHVARHPAAPITPREMRL